MVGRTHGIHAEPTTFGVKLALVGAAGAAATASGCAGARRRSRSASCRARSARTRTSTRPSSSTCARASGCDPCPRRRCSPRDRHAEVLYACASVGATIEAFAIEIRHLQRTEVREVEEPFREGEQKGSSAMPHKRNPVKSEQLCGLARVLRGNLQAALEDVALWHERDISHSSVERIIVPDSLMLAYYVLVKFTTDRRRAARVSRADAAQPRRVVRARVQPAGAARARRGRERRATTRTASCSATRCAAWQEERPFRELLADDPEVTAALDAARLDACFDLKRALANIGRVFDVLDALEEL